MELNRIENLQTMSSLEIAELTGKEHRNVLRDIQNQLGSLDGGVLRFEHTHTNPQNKQSYRIYRLPKRECMILISGYSVELRAKIIDRWQELESKVHGQNLSGSELIARAVIEAHKLLQEKETLITELTPKAEFADHVAESESHYDFREVCKELALEGIGEKRLFNWCREQGILMSSNEPYQEYVGRGLLKLVIIPFSKRDGTKDTHRKPVWTGKGLQWLDKKLRESGFREAI